MTPSTVSLVAGLADFERPSSEMIRVTQESGLLGQIFGKQAARSRHVLFDGAG